MPMSFPDLKSLERRAEQRGFRWNLKDESEEEYREAFADFMLNVDRVESAEIRSKVGWDVLQEDPATLLKMMGIDTSAFTK